MLENFLTEKLVKFGQDLGATDEQILSPQSSYRCLAIKRDGCQCSRRRKPGQKFCGKHCKNEQSEIAKTIGEDDSILAWEEYTEEGKCLVDVNGNVYMNDNGKAVLKKNINNLKNNKQNINNV